MHMEETCPLSVLSKGLKQDVVIPCARWPPDRHGGEVNTTLGSDNWIPEVDDRKQV
ncbi:hypothetical protein BDR03DRAFT_960756 [Suillus americanus]|nr:hypothetical protein BDR03DRAFT_960756 [Suillus americanus]